MKKSILTLLVLFVCAIQTTTAYEYFTIYFNDGTKSEAFYATDVDSICYSKLSLDSITYDDWQVQEIYTCDSVYRYPLAQIDSLSFKDVDENKVAENIANTCIKIRNLLNDDVTIEALSNNLSIIQNFEGIENAWIDNQTLFIKIQDYGIVPFLFPAQHYVTESRRLQTSYKSRANTIEDINQHIPIEAQRACIANQTVNDEQAFFDRPRNNAATLKSEFESIGIECKLIDPTPEFFSKDIFDFDLVFIITHGVYDKNANVHWLYTSEIIDDTNPKLWNNNTLGDIFLKFILKDSNLSPTKKSVGMLYEKRNEKLYYVFYTIISERYILTAPDYFNSNGKSIIFNVACESLKENDNMARAFVNKGAGCYMGFTDSNSIGDNTGKQVFENLLTGKSVYRSYQTLPDTLREETLFIEDSYNKMTAVYYPKFKCVPYNSNLCITHPETISFDDFSDKEQMSVKLRGRMKCANILGVLDDKDVGFQYSTYSDMSQAESIKAQGNYDSSTLYMNWEATLEDSDIKPNTTYYYRAYMNDGYSNCFGEVKSFTTKGGNAEAYCVWDEASKTATYYYDGMYQDRNGLKKKTEHWYVPKSTIKVIFDSSFSNYCPKFFSFSYSNSLQSIDNMKYLNTDSIDDMRCMFAGCKSLTSLDLSSFNTANVTDMRYMFDDCESLTSLDLSSFNTANVTDMDYMFHNCESLTSLDLSSFNTTNVTDMRCMFAGCKSLTSLDLSSFNTANVTDMSFMFAGCESLTSLDLSSFNTANVTDMSDMFTSCSGLTRLDISSFNTSNVTDMSRMFIFCESLTRLDLSSFNTANVKFMEQMFSHCKSMVTIYAGNWNWNCDGYAMFVWCDNLVGGKGTKIGKNLYGYDKDGNPLYYYCSDHAGFAHIDGGKDWPGLFTAK